jgi:hypothetical protein
MEGANALALGPAHPDIALLEDNAVAEKKTMDDYSYRTAASEATLSGGGLHAARFTVREGYSMFFGAIRADWNVQGGGAAHEVRGHCFYATGSGQRCPGRGDWQGMQTATQSDRIDLVLDLGDGSMTVLKNGEPLGVMQESGLGGAGVEYRWAVGLYNKSDSARIDAVPAAEVEALVQPPWLARAWNRRETAGETSQARTPPPSPPKSMKCALAPKVRRSQRSYTPSLAWPSMRRRVPAGRARSCWDAIRARIRPS